MSIIVLFFTLILVSLIASILRKKLQKYDFTLFTLSLVPAICAFMGLGLVLLLALQKFIIQVCPKDMYFAAFFGQIIIILGIGFCVFLYFARKRKMPFLKSCMSFFAGFEFSFILAIAFIVADAFIYYNVWINLKIHPSYSCEMQLNPLFTFCAEYDRRVLFKSGKKIGIGMDTCGLSNFKVNRLGNGWLYLECKASWGNSYIVDDVNEKVYMKMPNGISELKTEGMIDGMDIYEDKVIYYTYGKDGKNSYESDIKAIKDLFDNMVFLGEFSPKTEGFTELETGE